MTLEKAIELLKTEYEFAERNNEWIKNPIAYALYEVWKEADRGENK